MAHNASIRITPEERHDDASIRRAIANQLGISKKKIIAYQVVKESIDARAAQIYFQLTLAVFLEGDEVIDAFHFEPHLQQVASARPVHIIGAGPAGLFAALRCIELGLRPIVIERGKNVKDRRRDLAAMNKEGFVNPESNYCYGEGGAGTYSDGKLYTRSGKRGSIMQCLQWFHYFGADENILYKAHPHIGTNKLPHIISRMSEAIIACGGEVRFNTKLTDIGIGDNAVSSISFANGIQEPCDQLILATGHSASDIFYLLDRKNVLIEAKPFALGVRIEHHQELINQIQYRCTAPDPKIDILGAASYSLVSQENGKGVFSFCMCPGGIIAPASTEAGKLVVNGWSPSKRNGRYANSGMVVTVDEQDFARYGFKGRLAGLAYQSMVETAAWTMGGGKLVAPAQRLVDFCEGNLSQQLPECSYLPGVSSQLLNKVLPQEVYRSLSAGLRTFGKKMKGYYTNDAMVVATESRTSSPVKIPRDKETLQHIQVKGLYPCAEGAGYAGGIISAAIDGINVADAIHRNILN